MGRKEETEAVIRDLKGYLEFQSRMGNGMAIKTKTAKPSPAKPSSVSVAPPSSLFDGKGAKTLEEVREHLGDCERCKLHEGRKSIVFGEGNPEAKLVFVGEGPGKDEDEQGRPFIGRAGQLLGKIISAMNMERSDVYICNVVKCRPPENRNPEPDEVAQCEPFLLGQLGVISPRIVVCLGLVAAKAILKLGAGVSLGSLRGVFHEYGKTKLMVTYHPAALLRNPAFKRPLWDDMKVVMEELKKG